VQQKLRSAPRGRAPAADDPFAPGEVGAAAGGEQARGAG